MPRPLLPKAKEIADLAKVLRAEGFETICIETTPEGHVSISIGRPDGDSNVTPLQKWKAARGSA